jgi:hypothetical protein
MTSPLTTSVTGIVVPFEMLSGIEDAGRAGLVIGLVTPVPGLVAPPAAQAARRHAVRPATRIGPLAERRMRGLASS